MSSFIKLKRWAMLLRAKRALLLALMLSLAAVGQPALAADESETLYRFRSIPSAPTQWRDGNGGPISRFQRALLEALQAENVQPSQWPAVDGTYGPGTQRALALLLSLPRYADLAPAPGSTPRVSVALWERLLPGAPLPNAELRIDTLVLTYENTPFDDDAQWNFCQSRVESQRRKVQPCRSNDATSYLTWGPRGATAGGGREIQGVLIALDRTAASAIDQAFVSEAAAVRRFLRLRESRRSPIDLSTEIYLCGIWMDAARASQWAKGFAKLGAMPETRAAYTRLYRSANFDGAKMRGFARLYEQLGLRPSEVDFGFFVDRATHSGGVFAPGYAKNSTGAIAAVSGQVRQRLGPDQLSAWQVRRELSRILATPNMAADRLGRDVVFFVDSTGEAGLSASERQAWLKRGPRHASDVGLSDTRQAPVLSVSNERFPTTAEPMESLSAAEKAACPTWVLNWTHPNGRSRSPEVKVETVQR